MLFKAGKGSSYAVFTAFPEGIIADPFDFGKAGLRNLRGRIAAAHNACRDNITATFLLRFQRNPHTIPLECKGFH